MTGFVATAQTDVSASPERVWAALTEPEQIAVYMQGSRVATTWEVGTPITWDGSFFETLFGYEWELADSPAGATVFAGGLLAPAFGSNSTAPSSKAEPSTDRGMRPLVRMRG